MKSLHRASALMLSVFVLAHIGNHVAGLFGLEVYFRYLTAVRQVYRHPIGEPILIGLIIIQMNTGLAITVSAFQRRERRKLLSWIEIIAGWLFFLFITIHLASIALTRYYFEMETDFLWVATMMRSSPLQPFVIAFHFLGIVVVTTHMGIGFRYLLAAIALPRTGNLSRRSSLALALSQRRSPSFRIRGRRFRDGSLAALRARWFVTSRCASRRARPCPGRISVCWPCDLREAKGLAQILQRGFLGDEFRGALLDLCPAHLLQGFHHFV